MKNAAYVRPSALLIGLLLALLLAGCQSQPVVSGTTGATAQPTATPTDTPTALPSPTPTPTATPTALGTNLIVNGNAEQDGNCPNTTITVVPTIPGWTKTADITTIQYGASGGDLTPTSAGPSDRGNCYFWGGPDSGSAGNSKETMTQTIDVSSLAQMIDSASLTYQLSAWLGGYTSQDDSAALSIQFLSASSAALGTASVGPVLAKDRQDVTELLQRSANGAVPAQTRSIVVTVTFIKAAAGDNDGLADDLSLILQQK